MLYDTITAIATGPATGAISIIRLSGDKTFDILAKIFSRNLLDAKSMTIHHGYIINPNTQETYDEVLVAIFKKPHTYTGEDLAEINCHGGLFVTEQVLSLILEQGARMARPGEFTQRAFLNGRIDLTAAEAVNDLIKAQQTDQLVLANSELKGNVKKLLTPLMDDMVNIIGNIEVNIDYPEYEDVQVLSNDIVLPKVREWLKTLDELLERSYSGKIIREGVLTAIIGQTNVGKSSLLNALLEENKAIVTSIPGTTRDIVEGDVRLKNITLHLLDTAGIRETEDKIESLGIEKSIRTIKDAQLVILVIDDSKPTDKRDQELLNLTRNSNRIIVYNKTDISQRKDGICISALNNEIQPLIDEINARYQQVHETISHPALSNSRQIGLLKQARNALHDAQEGINNNVELDLVSIDLNNAHNCLREIVGTYTKEDLLDDIFSRFCLGK